MFGWLKRRAQIAILNSFDTDIERFLLGLQGMDAVEVGGILAMANAGPDTNGSQFYITHGPTPHLDGGYSIFGHVVEGQDVVNNIVIGDTIKTVKILRTGEKAKKFKGDQAEFEKLSKGA